LLKFWDDVEKRFDKLIFLKSDSPERIFQKKLVLNSALTTVFISLGVALISISFGLLGIAASFAAQAAVLDLETQGLQFGLLKQFADDFIEFSDQAFYGGFGVIVIGIILAISNVARQK